MSFLYFSTVSDGLSHGILGAIAEIIQPDPPVICSSILSLSQRLSQPLCDVCIAVMRLSSPEELLDIVALADRLTDFATVLILPDESSATVAMAHKIRPRFLAYPDSDPNMIAAVLAKMQQVYSKQPLKDKGKQNSRSSYYGEGNGKGRKKGLAH